MERRLERYAVPNYPHRHEDTALIYFRDPPGNLFEDDRQRSKLANQFLLVASRSPRVLDAI
jgi:hypothetical protein